MSDSEPHDSRTAAMAAARCRYDEDAAPVVAALRQVGFDVEGLSEIYSRKQDYRSAIPVLTAWLPRVSNPLVKQDIVRALTVKWARDTEAPRLLVKEFERVDDATDAGLRWAIGSALEVVANDGIAEDLLRIANERRYGKARQMVVVGLGKLKDPRAVELLLNLLCDEDVNGHAVMGLRRGGKVVERSRIEPMLAHPMLWVRREAKKLLAKSE